MSADILIHHCSLRIARRHGWSWGPDARALLRAALQRLPEMLAMRLAESWPEQLECEVVAPLRLRLSVRMEELLELGAGSGAGPAAGGAPGSLAQRLDTLLLELVQRASSGAPPAVPPESVAEEAAPDVNLLWAGTVLTVLLGWHRQGILQEQLLMFSQAALASWHASLQGAGAARSARAVPEAAKIAALAGEHAALALPLPAGVRASLVRRIGLMVAAAGEFGVSTADPAIAQAFAAHRAFELAPSVDAQRPDGIVVRPAEAQAAPVQSRRAQAPDSGRAALTSFDVKICSALPFLLLGPLSRTGYLQTVGAVFEAAQMLPALPALAVALARKVLEPPQRGWFRSAQSALAAAAFAGQPEPLPDANIADMARLLAPFVSPLDGQVASVLTAGHTPGSVLVLQAAAPGWILFEEEGMFPIAWAGTVERLFARMAALGGELLLVPQSALVPGLLTQLDDAGFRFITDAAPARGEHWRSVFAGPLRAWTNVIARTPPAITRLEHAGAASAQLWQGLTAERPLMGGAGVPEVERSLALAAALALGTISWSLWRERETATPLLALERFADFDGRVSFRPDLVQVHLPLGRRFMDLKGAGWLDDIADVPWLDGRPLRFKQG
jgi:hypothetical protein